MKQYPSHSQTPNFDVKISQTTKLYQEPTSKEIKSPSALWVNLRDLAIFITFAIASWFIISFIVSCILGAK